MKSVNSISFLLHDLWLNKNNSHHEIGVSCHMEYETISNHGGELVLDCDTRWNGTFLITMNLWQSFPVGLTQPNSNPISPAK